MTNLTTTTAKVASSKDISKLLDFFRYPGGTVREAARATGIKLNSAKWYARELSSLGLIHPDGPRYDTSTGRYSRGYVATEESTKNDKENKGGQTL